MEKKYYVVPPKLRQKLLLAGGLTVWELLIIVALALFNVARHNFFSAVLWPAGYFFLVVRIFSGKSLMDVIMIVFRYHFEPQFFTKSIQKKGQ